MFPKKRDQAQTQWTTKHQVFSSQNPSQIALVQ